MLIPMRHFPILFLLGASCWAQEVSTLSFLTGCWAMNDGPMVIEEEWGKPAADGMLGFSRTLKAGKTVFSEFMRIEKRGGQLIYTPRIGTKESPVEFKMIRQTASEIVFENLAHDFPQRILYRSVEGGLAARIEGKQNGKEKGMDFPYRRVSCEK